MDITPEQIAQYAQMYSNMSEEQLTEEIKKIKQVTGKTHITDEEKYMLFQSVSSVLSPEELNQLKILLSKFE